MSTDVLLGGMMMISAAATAIYFLGNAFINTFFRRKEELIRRIGGIED